MDLTLPSVVTVFTKENPTIGDWEFDAVLETTQTVNREMTSYPIENGASVYESVVYQPREVTMTVAVGTSALKPGWKDFVGGVVSNVVSSSAAALVAGLSAGWLAASESTRAAAAVETIVAMVEQGGVVTLVSGNMTWQNMLPISVEWGNDNGNEALVAQVSFRELVTVTRAETAGKPTEAQVTANGTLDNSTTSVWSNTPVVDSGKVSLQPATTDETIDNIVASWGS